MLSPQESLIDYTNPVYGGVSPEITKTKDIEMPSTESSTMTKDFAQNLAKGAAEGKNIEDIVGPGLMFSGSAPGMALGGSLMALSAVNKAKQERANQRYIAAVRQQEAKQRAISQLANIGQNLRLG